MTIQEISPGWALRQPDPVAALQQVFNNVRQYASRTVSAIVGSATAVLPSVVVLAQASLCVLFGFAMVFFSAVIGG